MVAKALRDFRYRLFYGLVLNRRYPLEELGGADSICRWTICPLGLNARSVVYSAGLGSDITFEHALVQKFGCDIVMIDPSPTGVKTMDRPENKIPQFHFQPVALAGRNGKIRMDPPLDPTGDSWFASNAGSMEVPSLDLVSLMEQNRHPQIDLLKLDIEGCEYEVLDHVLAHRLPVHQICVEFHHGILPGFKRSQTIRSMLSLLRAGYKLVDQTGANHTFISRRFPSSD